MERKLGAWPLEIRKVIYTTNTIENMNRGIRKYTQFVDKQSATKAIFLAIQNIEKSWQKPIQNWIFYTNLLLSLQKQSFRQLKTNLHNLFYGLGKIEILEGEKGKEIILKLQTRKAFCLDKNWRCWKV